MERVQLKGISELAKEQKYQLNKIVNSYYEKIKRSVKNEFTLVINLKKYQKPGNNHKAYKYSIQALIRMPTRKLEASASDWDLNRTLHSVLKKLMGEIEHRFRVSEQGRGNEEKAKERL